MFTTQDRGLLAVYPGLRYTRGCLAPTNIVHFLFLSFAFYGMMTVAGSGHSSRELCHLAEQSWIFSLRRRWVTEHLFLKEGCCSWQVAGRMMWVNGLIACLFYVTSWEISIVYLLSCIWIWCLNLNLAPAAAARPGQAAAPGTLYNDVESPSSELVLSKCFI